MKNHRGDRLQGCVDHPQRGKHQSEGIVNAESRSDIVGRSFLVLDAYAVGARAFVRSGGGCGLGDFVASTTFLEGGLALLEVRAVVPSGYMREYTAHNHDLKRKGTHSGPMIVMRTTKAATTPMRIPCTFA